MTTPRQKASATATFLGATAIAVAIWLVSRGGPEPERPAQTATERIENAATGPGRGTATAPTSSPERGEAQIEATRRSSSEPAETRAVIEVHIHFATADNRAVRLRAVDEQALRVVGRATCSASGVEAIGYLDVTPQRWLHVEAVVREERSGIEAHVPGRRLYLDPGQRYRIDLHAAGTVTLLRIDGPSHSLAPHLRVELMDRGLEDLIPFELPLGADATVACFLRGTTMARVILTSTRRRSRPDAVALITATGATAFEPLPAVDLSPIEAVLGLAWRSRDRAVPAALSLDGEVPLGEAVACTVSRRSHGDAATAIVARTATGELHRIAVETLDRRGDLWQLDQASGRQLGELEVSYGEAAFSATPCPLAVVSSSGATTIPLDRRNKAILEPGTWRLVWAPHDAPLEDAAPAIRIEAGKWTRVVVSPRSLERWRIRLIDAPEMLLALHLGELHSLGMQGDRFLIDLGRPPRLDEAVRLDAWPQKSSFAGRITAVDSATREAEVTSDAARATPTHISYAPLESGRTRIRLVPGYGQPLGGRLHGNTVLMLPGERRHGAVIETIDDTPQLTRWFEVVAGTSDLQLAARGRWATVTLDNEFTTAQVVLEGPTGAPVDLRLPIPNGSQRLYVADGTTAVHVDVSPGGRQSFDPRLAEFVVR